MSERNSKNKNTKECEALKKENEALKNRVKELEKQIATYNLHFAKGKIR